MTDGPYEKPPNWRWLRYANDFSSSLQQEKDGPLVVYSVRGLPFAAVKRGVVWMIEREIIRPGQKELQILVLGVWPLLISNKKAAQTIASLCHPDTNRDDLALLWVPVTPAAASEGV